MRRSIFHIHRCWIRGLTLGEMLVVLAVFMILAVMFFMNSSMAITKTKLARVMQDQKVLVRALYTYEGEYYSVPNDTQGQGLLTVAQSPVTMLSRVPIDPFASTTTRQQEYGYYSNLSPRCRWVLVSVGPDGYPDLDRALVRVRKRGGRSAMAPAGRFILMNDHNAQNFLNQYTYDPTNGATSRGDVITIYGQN